MSKIYEALQRAEQERLAGIVPPETTTPEPAQKPEPPVYPVASGAAPAQYQPQPEAQVQVQPQPPVPLQPQAAASLLEVAPVMAVASALPVPASGERNNINAIPVHRWTPNLEKLPALQERGAAVEQFRTLRTRLFGFRDLNKLKSILVSSGLPREGKSFIAANLAVSFARHKSSRVLLIDGDMRRSSLHNILGCEKSPGLSTYLAGDASGTEVMQRAQPNDDGSPLFAGLGSLTFIPGGEEGDKAADLSGSKRFRELLDFAAPHFDWIIVDSSPVNLVTDGVNLASSCDGVLLVARGGVTRFQTAQRAMSELKGSKMLGVVLNAVDRSVNGTGYYGYDGYGGYESYDSPIPETTETKETTGTTA